MNNNPQKNFMIPSRAKANMKQLGNSFYATIVHQMKLKPTKEDAPIKLR